ncbi:dhp1-interacting protein [Niveomyces insectorum RCEF 264]|uniref:Decapping nuclease n=1 Tax=Niveomyces insectorum RCEF 264 TaxID=1081102 RepID=A0A167ULX9_9HYPO|nr:dhp1-interacting protein [Niveomyces insectorum RCEF 264]
MAEFAIHPVQRFAGPSQPVRRPKEFTCFSYDDDHALHLDDRSLRWYYPPQQLDVDLSRGFERFDQLDEASAGDEHLDSLLAAIAAHEQSTGAKIDAQVVTWRGMMTKIMASPYDDRDGFIEENHAYKVAAQREQNARRSRPPARPNPNQPWFPPEVMTYWGYKFETLATLPAPWGETSRDYIEGRDGLVVSNKAQYCSVVRTGIGPTILCLGGEVDAVWDAKPNRPGDPVHWVELKTSQVVDGPRDLAAFERKLLKFWLQSFLLGVPTIVVGFRSRAGRLVRLEEIATATIPGTVRQRAQQAQAHYAQQQQPPPPYARGPPPSSAQYATPPAGPPWDGDTCINFAAAFLGWLRTVISEDNEDGGDGVWRIRRRPGGKHIEVFRVETTGHGRILPDTFLNWRIKLAVGGAVGS